MLYQGLPTECILGILEYLPIQQLNHLRTVSKEWNEFISQNETSIYRYAALMHGIVESERMSLVAAKGIHASPWLDEISSWRELCKAHYQIHASWIGRVKPNLTSRMYPAQGGDPYHRIKIDEVERTFITTSHSGVLRVATLETGDLLWSIKTGPYAHCEFDNGFIIFNRQSVGLEVWRRSLDHQRNPLPATAPDDRQLATAASFPHNRPPRGCFVPFTVLRNSVETRAFRFVWPNLYVALSDGSSCIWDLPTATRIQTFAPPLIPDGFLLTTYVEVSQRHAFQCVDGRLWVYDRRDCKLVLVIEELDFKRRYVWPFGTTAGGPTIRPLRPETAPPSEEVISDILAAHVSPDGEDLVAISEMGSLLFIPGFQRAINTDAEIGDIGYLIVGRGLSDNLNLAFNGRRIVIGTDTGIYSITLTSEHERLHPRLTQTRSEEPDTNSSALFPSYGSSLFRLEMWEPRISLIHVSCVQMTETGVWLVAPKQIETPFPWLKHVHYIDFSRKLPEDGANEPVPRWRSLFPP